MAGLLYFSGSSWNITIPSFWLIVAKINHPQSAQKQTSCNCEVLTAMSMKNVFSNVWYHVGQYIFTDISPIHSAIGISPLRACFLTLSLLTSLYHPRWSIWNCYLSYLSALSKYKIGLIYIIRAWKMNSKFGKNINLKDGPGQLSIVTGLWAGQPRFNSQNEQEMCLFSIAYRAAWGPTQPSIHWVLGALSLAVKHQRREADSSSSVEVKNIGAIPPLPHVPSWHGA
jgi:hypothetical protein